MDTMRGLQDNLSRDSHSSLREISRRYVRRFLSSASVITLVIFLHSPLLHCAASAVCGLIHQSLYEGNKTVRTLGNSLHGCVEITVCVLFGNSWVWWNGSGRVMGKSHGVSFEIPKPFFYRFAFTGLQA